MYFSHAMFCADLRSPSSPSCVPQFVDLRERFVHWVGRAEGQRDRGADQLQLGLHGGDAGVRARGRGGGGPLAPELVQAQAEVADLALQGEVAEGTRFAGGEGVTVAPAAHVAARPRGAQAAHTHTCLLVAAPRDNPSSGTGTRYTATRGKRA